VAITIIALVAYRQFVKKNDAKLRDWVSPGPTKFQWLFFALSAVVVFGNALLVRSV
jgi:hypothetical protein